MVTQAIPAGGVSQRKERANTFLMIVKQLHARVADNSCVRFQPFQGDSNMNPISRLVSSSIWLLVLSLFPLFGCDNGPPASGAKSEVEQVSLHVENVPENVACLSISAIGTSRQMVRDIEVTLGQSVTESFGGLPIGTVVFQALAYSQTCDAVTKSTVPSWVSEEVPVTVSLTQSKSVTLTLYRNGRAKVTVGFDPETPDAGTPGGA
jgi:hypothetical protein